MPQESISTRPTAAPPALSGDSVHLPQPLFLLLFWSTWLRERFFILLPALAVLCLVLSVLGPVFARIYEDMLPGELLPRSTRLALGFGLWLGHGWPVLLFLVVLVLLLPTVLRWQLRARFPADALPDLVFLRVRGRPVFVLAASVLVIAAGLFLLYAFLRPLVIGDGPMGGA